MKVSVVLTVLNESGSIRAVLDSLAAQSRPADEVVVCDGGSRDGTLAVLHEYAARLPLRIIEAPGANIAQGRNAAIRAASGEVIAVTDGGVRDSPEIAGFELPVFFGAPSAPLNLTLHHAVDMNVPIGCGGVPVFPGDVIFGDGEGVVVIPKHLAAEVANDAAEQELLETFVIEEVRKGAPVIGTYPPSPTVKAHYDQWRAARKR